jgi:hypothetical protein
MFFSYFYRMNKCHGWAVFFICLFLMHEANGRAHSLKKKNRDLRLIEAYTQKRTPGRREFPAETTMNIVVEWRSKTSPETFFWRGEGGWLTCRMVRAHRLNTSATVGSRPIAGLDYSLEAPDNNPFHKGDTLMLTPVTGGKFPIPAAIPESARNTLFYKTVGSEWKAFPIDSIAKKRDILAP